MTTLVRWEPFRELASFQNEMSRFMNGLLEGNGRTTESWVPAVDVWETDRELMLSFDLPGIPAPRYRVYPMADHIADKLCALLETHPRAT